MFTPKTKESCNSRSKVIVEKEMLLSLFSTCRHDQCGAVVDREDIQVKTVGAAISIVATCANSHEFKWDSSPTVGKSKRQIFCVNIELASYVVLCGLDITQVFSGYLNK